MAENKQGLMNLEDRMKSYYETVPKSRLVRRMPVICRIDGCHFHNFLRGFSKPFDLVFIKSMQDTAKYLCSNIQGCVLSFQHSDEISLLLTDYATFDTQAWFGYEVQKMCSVGASMATMAFNKALSDNLDEYCRLAKDFDKKYADAVRRAIFVGATFDFRCFNIPKEEVVNCFLWRQQDAARNSVQMLAQFYYSHSETHKKTNSQLQDMLMTEHSVNWNDLPTYLKRGSCCVRHDVWVARNNRVSAIGAYSQDDILAQIYAPECIRQDCFDSEPSDIDCVYRPKFFVDLDIPRFVNEGRDYIERWIN